LTLNGQNIPFVSSVKYLAVILDKRITWRIHTGVIHAKACRTYIRVYCLLQNERLSANIKLTLHKELIGSLMAYTYPAREFAADTHLIKLQSLQNKILRTIGYLQAAHRFIICTGRSRFLLLAQTYAVTRGVWPREVP
jgi:hypothetical protein